MLNLHNCFYLVHTYVYSLVASTNKNLIMIDDLVSMSFAQRKMHKMYIHIPYAIYRLVLRPVIGRGCLGCGESLVGRAAPEATHLLFLWRCGLGGRCQDGSPPRLSSVQAARRSFVPALLFLATLAAAADGPLTEGEWERMKWKMRSRKKSDGLIRPVRVRWQPPTLPDSRPPHVATSLLIVGLTCWE